MQDFALILRATFQMYLECVGSATKGFIRNWPAIIASLMLFLAFMLIYKAVAGLGPAGGFILGLASAFFTAQYYSWLSDTVAKDKVTWQDIFRPDLNLFLTVISVSFVLFIVYYLSSSLQSTEQTRPVLYLVYFMIVFAFNSLPEVVYIKRYDGLNAFSEALRFTKENWIEWYLPFILLLLPVLLTSDPAAILLRFALLYPLYPGLLIMQAWLIWLSSFEAIPYLAPVVGFLIAHWYMLFRGFLFKELESGSRRRRVYLAKQK